MPVKTSRADGNAAVRVDRDLCTLCGMCVKVCRGGPLHIENKEVFVDYSRGLGCIACGHCAAVCPQKCITVEGRDIFPSDVVPLPAAESRASYEELRALLLSRRSIRQYEPGEVEQEVIDRILAAATTAPMGVPPSDVGVLVFKGRDKMRAFTRDMLEALRRTRRMFSGLMLHLWRPIIGKAACDMFRTFLLPLIDAYIESDRQGVDLFAYDAPLGMLFYSSPSSDPGDSIIAATYAMVAAEALGLGSCMLGFPAPVLKRSKKLLAKYGITPKSQIGIMVVFGYPAVKFQHAITRRFAEVRYW